jgi:hypothetical protein
VCDNRNKDEAEIRGTRANLRSATKDGQNPEILPKGFAKDIRPLLKALWRLAMKAGRVAVHVLDSKGQRRKAAADLNRAEAIRQLAGADRERIRAATERLEFAQKLDELGDVTGAKELRDHTKNLMIIEDTLSTIRT